MRVVRVPGLSSTFGFDFLLARPDLSLDEADLVRGIQHTSDLPKAIRTESVTIRSGQFSHSCSHWAPRSFDGIPLEEGRTFQVDAVFMDGSHGTASISVPLPPPLSPPTVLEPKLAPAQGDALRVKFRDVGADSYEVRVSLCHEYRNDGINPCFDGRAFFLVRRAGVLVGQDLAPGEGHEVRVVVRDGTVSLESPMRLRYSVRVVYSIVAKLRAPGPGDIELTTEQEAGTGFEAARLSSR